MPTACLEARALLFLCRWIPRECTRSRVRSRSRLAGLPRRSPLWSHAAWSRQIVLSTFLLRAASRLRDAAQLARSKADGGIESRAPPPEVFPRVERLEVFG